MHGFAIIAALLLANACWAGSKAYLRAVGPTAIRLLESANPVGASALPPLAMTGDEPATQTVDHALTDPPATLTRGTPDSPGSVLVDTAASSSAPDQYAPVNPETATPSQADPTYSRVITPEMFLRYFPAGGGRRSGKEAVVIVPPEFFPPNQTETTVRSKATYSTPPR